MIILDNALLAALIGAGVELVCTFLSIVSKGNSGESQNGAMIPGSPVQTGGGDSSGACCLGMFVQWLMITLIVAFLLGCTRG